MKPYFQSPLATLYCGDSRDIQKHLLGESIDLSISSPPYFQKVDYGTGNDQIGLEDSISDYLASLQAIYEQTFRLTKIGGCCWVIIDDVYNNLSFIGAGSRDRKLGGLRGQTHKRRKLIKGYREKELLRVPSSFIDMMREIGWLYRADCIWDKGVAGDANPSDRPRRAHEYVLMFFRPERGAGRPHANCKPLPSSVLRFAPDSDPIHPCPFPPEMVQHLLKYSCPRNGLLLDPFAGSGRSLVGATRSDVHSIGIEISERFCDRATQYYQEKIYSNAA